MRKMLGRVVQLSMMRSLVTVELLLWRNVRVDVTEDWMPASDMNALTSGNEQCRASDDSGGCDDSSTKRNDDAAS